ncbi:carbon-nitrogen hydrolase family protein [Actimicrobium antarcticum]|uniref:Carbon-nitrogen hydrolase family protein n=1 Tax=Actimicrobium antarcticum TaxID=1051899 RepID=A0ABP7TFA9_9BURK
MASTPRNTDLSRPSAIASAPFALAAIQMVSTPSVAHNLQTARRLVAEAAGRGAQLVLLPEYWPIMGMHETDKVALAESAQGGPIQQCMADMAREHGIWVIGGTLPMVATEAGKIRNSTLVYNPAGEAVVRYDKIHLFSFTKGQESYDEARTIAHGAEVTTFEAPFGRVGLSVCYDLRFPELYRAMGHCALIVVPAAFTWTTGQAHWEILLRARAIENQCYVLAAAQGGRHENGRRTWGHSMLIDPWGEIKAVLPEGEGVVFGQIEPHHLEQVRISLPALEHRRL